MDNLTYDAVNVSPSNDDNDTYSKLSTVQQFSTTRLHTRIQLQEKSGRIHSELNGVKSDNIISKPSAQWKKIVLVAAALLMIILLLTSLVSIVLSVDTYTRLVSFTNESDDHTKINQDLSSVQTPFVATQTNITNILTEFDRINQDLLSLETQLVATQSNVSQTLAQLDARIGDFISTVQTQNPNLQTQLYCGPGQWRRVAYLNMSDPREHCPPAWELYNTSGVRACGRQGSMNCAGMSYSTGYQYRSVCGRVIGYQKGSPDAFADHGNRNIDLDGINITHGAQRSHIWSYVASLYERSHKSNCPCNGPSTAKSPPSSIDGNYYCESGNPNSNFVHSKLYSDDKLWDGQNCDSEGTCCSGINNTVSPPWFSVQLPAPTNDSIEVHICGDQPTGDEDTPIELLELFVG